MHQILNQMTNAWEKIKTRRLLCYGKGMNKLPNCFYVSKNVGNDNTTMINKSTPPASPLNAQNAKQTVSVSVPNSRQKFCFLFALIVFSP